MSNHILQQYTMCPICKNLIYKHHIQYHYRECKQKDDERKIREELQKHAMPPHLRQQMLYQQQQQELKKKIQSSPIVKNIIQTVFPENQKKQELEKKKSNENQKYIHEMKINIDLQEMESKTDLQKQIEQMKQEIEQNEIKKQQKIKELEQLKKQKEFEEMKKQKEFEEMKKQKEFEEIKKQKELEEIKKQKEFEEIKKQKELDEIKKQKELDELKKQKEFKKEKEKEKEKQKENQELITVENYRPPTTVSIYHEQVMYHFFMLYEKLFYEYVQGKTIALVGPAESILGTGRGHIIDKFDVVVRLNKSIPLPKDLSRDIGTRTDVLYNSLNTSDFPGENKLSPTLHKKYGIKFVCSSYPCMSVFREDILHYVRKYKFELPFKVMDERKFRKFEQYLGTRPYTGTCAIMELLSFPIKYLYITGLDFYYSKYYSQYREISKGQLKYTRNSNIHNAKPQLQYLKNIALVDDRVLLDPFLTKIVFEDYDRIWNQMKSIKKTHIFGFQNEQIKQYFEMNLCKVCFTKEYMLPIQEEKPIFIFTNLRDMNMHENQYIFYISTQRRDVLQIQEKGYTNYVGNFYFTQQNVKEIPTMYLHTKFLHEMKTLLQKFNMKNPSLHFLLFLAILLYIPQDDILIYEKDSSLWMTNLEEKKFCMYLLRKKVFQYQK